MKRRRWKRRLFWIGLALALILLWLVTYAVRAAEAVVSAARAPARARRPVPKEGRI